MGKITILPDTLISQIAAGEVVERPASVVKELIENSVDAGASQCFIELEQGGMKLISVRDNGVGMSPEDAKMAFARHATSKISSFDDLANIRSFGFRGEALAAIASVAMVTMKTRQKEYNSGHELVVHGGKYESEKSIGCAAGTEITVRNLFFNTPARKKFLKTETTELSHVMAVVSHMAVSHPHIGFQSMHNGKVLLNVPSSSVAVVRLTAVLGKNFIEDAVAVEFKTPSIHIHGYVLKPGSALSTKRHQYLFINGRDVSDTLVARAVCDAYGSRLPPRNYPQFVLHIDLDPSEVDVNVHPRKLTVKFLDTQRIYRDVSQAVLQALDGFQEKIFHSFASVDNQKNEPYIGQSGMNFEMPMSQNRGAIKEKNPAQLSEDFSSPQILAQINDSYIVIAHENEIAIVDQHAAHERIMYEKFKREMLEKKPHSQRLIVPVSIEMSSHEALILKQAVPHLRSIGFECEEWSGGTFVVHAHPADLKSENISQVIKNFLHDMLSEKVSSQIISEKMLKSLACKAAVKFGMKLSSEEQKGLIIELQKTPNNATCPHGRPTKIAMSFSELERRFLRRK